MNAELVVNAIAGIGGCSEAELPDKLEALATSLGYKHAAIIEARLQGAVFEPIRTVCRSREFSRSCRAVVDKICQSREAVHLYVIGEGAEMTSSVRETRTFAAAGVHLEQLCVPGEKTILLLVTDDPAVRLSDVEIRLLSTVGTLVSRALTGKKQHDPAASARDQIGMVSHDLRSPLGNIINYANMLLDPDMWPETDQKRAAIGIRRNSLYMMQLIRDLLDSVSIEGGRMAVTTVRCDLSKLVRESVERHEVPAREKDIRLTAELPAQPVEVEIDPSKIAQVVDNLISNALKFSRSGTCVKVGIDAAGGEALIRVEDQGLGIEPAELDNLFRKFSMTSTRATRGEKSTGLGLYIVSQMVQMHGGQVTVDSTPRVGSTFTVHLPVRR